MKRYMTTRDFAGVRDGRVAYFDTFADANREAMRAAAHLDTEVKVRAPNGEFLVSYMRGPEGRAIVLCVGTARQDHEGA